jgi:tRNA(Ile)-lysidine synthase
VIPQLLARTPLLFELAGAPVVVACSGGADSTALLALAVEAGTAPIAVHVDHGLRSGSAAEAVLVEAAARRVGAVGAVRRTVALVDGPNLEARARDARYRELEAARDEVGAQAVLVAHTMDDQAETVLLALLRGSASAGLGGMPERRDRLVRPLLGLRRSETHGVCRHLGLAVVDDPMNRDERHQRSWVRHQLLPTLSARAERDLVPVLARQATVLRAESDYLDGLARAALAEAGEPPAVKVLAALDPVVLRRAVRLVCGSPPVPLAHVDAVVEVVQGRVLGHELPGGRRVRRADGRLVVAVG